MDSATSISFALFPFAWDLSLYIGKDTMQSCIGPFCVILHWNRNGPDELIDWALKED